MKKLIYFALVAFTLSFVACSGNDPVMTPPQGAIAGIFSVGLDTKVYFSNGNLQAKTNPYPNEPNWYFADHQWDTIGSALSVRIEHFTWNAIKGDYPNTFVDWKNSAIENGNKGKTTWRVLTAEEWHYLFCERKDADSLFTTGKINGVNGVILLPDNWSNEKFDNAGKGLIYKPEEDGYWNKNKDNFSFIIRDGYAWTVMEQAGAVFLPAAGSAWEGSPGNVNEDCAYWSATPLSETGANEAWAYNFYGSDSEIWLQSTRLKAVGMSLRLVVDVK